MALGLVTACKCALTGSTDFDHHTSNTYPCALTLRTLQHTPPGERTNKVSDQTEVAGVIHYTSLHPASKRWGDYQSIERKGASTAWLGVLCVAEAVSWSPSALGWWSTPVRAPASGTPRPACSASRHALPTVSKEACILYARAHVKVFQG